ncbi:hypothetical protein Emag_001444 [Eimeria magna]
MLRYCFCCRCCSFARLSRLAFSPAALRALPQSCAFAAAAAQCSSSSSSTSNSDDDSRSISSRSSSRSETSAESQVERSTGSNLSSSTKGKTDNEGSACDDFRGCCLESSTLNLAAREATAAAATSGLSRDAEATKAQLSPTAAEPPPASSFVVSTGECGCGNFDLGEALLFEYRHISFEGEAFHPVGFDVSLPPPVLLHAVQQHASCPWLLQRRQELYGPSNLLVECRSLGSLFAAEVLQPFYLCQILAILLWLADDYYCYAIVIAIITAAATVADVLSTRQAAVLATESDVTVEESDRNSFAGDSFAARLQQQHLYEENGAGAEDYIIERAHQRRLAAAATRLACALRFVASSRKREAPACGTFIAQQRGSYPQVFAPHALLLSVFAPGGAGRAFADGGVFSRAEELESRHMVFAGTVVLSSTGSAEAEGIGDESLSFLLCLAALTVVAASYTAFFLYSRGVPLGRTLIRIADLFTDALPPALRATLSVSLTAAAARIFSLYGISCLSPSRLNICGFVRCVCLDKTGTLTEDGVSLLGCMPICHCGDGRKASSFTERISEVAANSSSSAASNSSPSCFGNALVSPAMLRSRGCGYHSYCSCRVHLLQCMSCCSSLASVDGRVAGDPLEACLLAASGWRLLDAACAAEAAANPTESDGPTAADEYEMLRQRVGGAAASDGPTFFIPQQQTGDDRMLTHNTVLSPLHYLMIFFIQAPVPSGLPHDDMRSLPGVAVQIYSKGSPESLLPLCDKETVPSGTERRVTGFAAAGYRVLVAAWRPLEQGEDWQTLRRCRAERGLRYLGLFVFENKLKGDAKETISALREAHIDIRILTGDSPHTAIGVAADCGVLDSKEESGSGSFCGCSCCTCAVGGHGGDALADVGGQENSGTPLQQQSEHLHMQQQERQQHPLGQLLHVWKGRETLRIPPFKRALILGEVCSRHEESDQQQQQQHKQDSHESHGNSFLPEASAGSSMPLVHPNAQSSSSVSSQLLHADDLRLQCNEDEQRRPSTHVDKLRDVVEDLLFQTPLLQPQQPEHKSLDAGTEDGGLLAHFQELPHEHVGSGSYPPLDGFLLESGAVQQHQQEQQEDEELLQQEAAEAVQQHLGELQQHHPGELLLPDAAARASLSRVDRIQELLHQSSACRRAEVAQAAAEEPLAAVGTSQYSGISRDNSSSRGGGAMSNPTSVQHLFDPHTLTRISTSYPRSPCTKATAAEAVVSPKQQVSTGSSRWSLKSLSSAARRLGLSRKSAVASSEALCEPLLHTDPHQPLPSPQQARKEQREHRHRNHFLQQEQLQTGDSLERPSGPPLAAASVDALMHHENCVGALGGMVLTFALRRCCCRCRCCRGTVASAVDTQSTIFSPHHSLTQPFQQQTQERHGVCVGGVSQHFKMSLYEFVLRRTALLCRANPQDKGDFISALQRLPSSPFVAMAGDGTNDLLAIKRADMGVSLSDSGGPPATASSEIHVKKSPLRSDGGQGLQGASLASSFTIGKLSSCVALLREGRCVLQNSISTVVFITLYSIIELSSVVCLYRLAGNLTDSQVIAYVLCTTHPSVHPAGGGPIAHIAATGSSPDAFIRNLAGYLQHSLVGLLMELGWSPVATKCAVFSVVLCCGRENLHRLSMLLSLLPIIATVLLVQCCSPALQLRTSASPPLLAADYRSLVVSPLAVSGLLKNRRCVLYMGVLGGLCVSFLLCPPHTQDPPHLPSEALLTAAEADGGGGFFTLFLRFVSSIWGFVILLRRALYSWLGLVPLGPLLRLQLLLLSGVNCAITVAYELFAVRQELDIYLKNREEGGDSVSHIPKTKGACHVTLLSPGEQTQSLATASSPSTARSPSALSPPIKPCR